MTTIPSLTKDLKAKLEGYKELKACNIAGVKPGDKLRYFSNNTFKGGGVVKRNSYPDYIVLLNVVNNASWCLQLKDPGLSKIWIKSIEKTDEERKEKEDIYRLYKEGKLVKINKEKEDVYKLYKEGKLVKNVKKK